MERIFSRESRVFNSLPKHFQPGSDQNEIERRQQRIRTPGVRPPRAETASPKPDS